MLDVFDMSNQFNQACTSKGHETGAVCTDHDNKDIIVKVPINIPDEIVADASAEAESGSDCLRDHLLGHIEVVPQLHIDGIPVSFKE